MGKTQANNDPFELVMAEYLQRIDRGEAVDREKFIVAHPEAADRLQAHFAKADAVRAIRSAGFTETEVRSPLAADASPAARVMPSQDTGSFAPSHCFAGRYEIRSLLGRGGMGVVYLARDRVLDRLVALKTLSAMTWNSEEQVTRLLDEARTTASLKHAGIVTVHDAGRDSDGLPFLVMEFIDGQPLSKTMKADPPDLSRAANILAAVAEAMAHAHRQGFVHRDLKPANIMIDGEGRPHVTDFGLALHESRQRQRPGESSGTLFYLAPEQARAESHRLDGRTDIWALGVVLYELLVHCRPFEGDTPMQVEDEILHRDPKPPRQIDDAVPVELERICLKCLAKDPTCRYMTASDLAGDLRRWMKPSRPHRRLLWAAAALATTLLAMVAWRVGKQGSNETDPTVTNSATAALKGKIDIRVWRNDDPACQDISVADAKVRPLRLGDRFSIRAELSRPAYLYVLDIDGQGQITPLYPWQPGKWHTLPADQKPVERISLPDGNRLGKIKPPGGLETLLLLARETPLTDDSELLALLPAMPPQAVGNRRAMFVLTNGQRDDVVDVTADVGGTRTYDISEADQIDAVLGSLHALYEHLSPQFSLVRTVTVVNQGE